MMHVQCTNNASYCIFVNIYLVVMVILVEYLFNRKGTKLTAKDAVALAKQLEEERKRSTSLLLKLKKAKSDKKTLEQSIEDGSFIRMHSTMRDDNATHDQNSLLMSSMSNLSFASLQVPECKPIDGEEDIDRKSYEQWRQMLEASKQLAGVADERTKMNIFRVKAGLKLLDVLEGTHSNADSPDMETFPYSNATQRLDAFFGSRDYIFMQRQKLRSLTQKLRETDVKYVKRVISVAKVCDNNDSSLIEQVVDTIQSHALNRKVRETGRKILRKGGSIADLLEKVRALEMETLNEEMFARTHRAAAQAEVAAVRYGGQRNLQQTNNGAGGTRYQQYYRFSGNWRGARGGRGYAHREFTRNVSSRLMCWRCLSKQHNAAECYAIDKVCRNCQRKRHLERACHQEPANKPIKRRYSNDDNESTNSKKIAVVKTDGDDLTEESICIGSVTTKAHRSQLRVQNDSKNSPNVAVPCRSHCKRRLVSEEEFLGFPDDVAAKRFRKGDNEATEPKTPSPRHSERLKDRPRRVYKR
ncbi:uncharacterized protein LOC129729374 [Wyeomyia smithii]|uniref:uncharacterized protein LOC129729374 n=1 Tax=Wyeomyia smithii TaxID=174621 RepID=UPI002467EE7F|nr:uncharacterized protein LOC129729374 [Wyeomyia smithii]